MRWKKSKSDHDKKGSEYQGQNREGGYQGYSSPRWWNLSKDMKEGMELSMKISGGEITEEEIARALALRQDHAWLFKQSKEEHVTAMEWVQKRENKSESQEVMRKHMLCCHCRVQMK